MKQLMIDLKLKEADFAVTRRNEFEDFDKSPLIEVLPALNTGSLNTALKGPGCHHAGYCYFRSIL